MDDSELVARTLGGATDAFDALVGKYQAPLFAMAWARVGDRHDAEDLCQETFLRAYRALPRLRKRAAFGPWLRTILRNLTREFFRGRWHLLDTPLEHAAKTESAFQPKDPRADIEERDRWEQLWATVEELDERSREVLVLHYGQGLSLNEVAGLLGISEAAVKMRLMRGRKRLEGDTARLREAWALAPPPLLKANIGKAIAASPGAWMVLPAVGAGLLTGWFLGRDLDQWRDHVSPKAVRTGKSVFLLAGLFYPTYLVAIHFARRAGVSGYWVAAPFLALPLFGTYIFLREAMTFGTRTQKVRVLAWHVVYVVLVVCMLVWRELVFVLMGLMFFLMHWQVDPKTMHGKRGPLPFGVWVKLLLRQSPVESAEVQPVVEGETLGWLRLLNRLGLLRGPLRKRDGACTANLVISKDLFGYLPWRPSSTIEVTSEGTVWCRIAPAQSQQLRRDLLDVDVPGHRVLNQRLSAVLTQSLQAYRISEDAAIAVLGRDTLPATRSGFLVMMRYILPAMGALLMILGLARLFD